MNGYALEDDDEGLFWLISSISAIDKALELKTKQKRNFKIYLYILKKNTRALIIYFKNNLR